MALETDLADLSKQPRDLPLLATKETCTGNTYIVTGANVGLGFEAAQHLVNLGAATVILAVRNLAAGDAAKAKIEESTGRSGVAEVWHLDMSSYDSVQTFAQKASTDLDRIDALIENAGVANSYGGKGNLSEYHLPELTINVYSTVLLALLIMPKLRDVAQRYGTTPHIAIVSSTAWIMNPLPIEKVREDPLGILEADQSLQPAV
jgi:NAD(P)-dependent dehydrogenase (short-subunit alcohol dehydrogenase family)